MGKITRKRLTAEFKPNFAAIFVQVIDLRDMLHWLLSTLRPNWRPAGQEPAPAQRLAW